MWSICLLAPQWVRGFLRPVFLQDTIGGEGGTFLMVSSHIILILCDYLCFPLLLCCISLGLLCSVLCPCLFLLLLKVMFLLNVLDQLPKLRGSGDPCLATEQLLPCLILHLLFLLIQLMFVFPDS